MLTALAERLPILKDLLDFIYPPLCAGCGAYIEESDPICVDCIGQIEWFDKPVLLTDIDFRPKSVVADTTEESFPLFAAGNYADPLREIVIQYKFRGVTQVAALIASRLAARFGEKIQKLGPAMLVPIPLHPGREYLRGYNQALIFAKQLATLLELPLNDGILIRVARRQPQSRLKRSKRAANIRACFALGEEVPGASDDNRVLLVDDVLTSGQTMFEARRTLDQGGFRVVGAITMARSL